MEIESVNRAADLLKAMSHPYRLVILHRLTEGSCRAAEFQKLLLVDQAVVSQHLARLRFGRVIVGKRTGKTIQYELTDNGTKDLVRHIGEIFFQKI